MNLLLLILSVFATLRRVRRSMVVLAARNANKRREKAVQFGLNYESMLR